MDPESRQPRLGGRRPLLRPKGTRAGDADRRVGRPGACGSDVVVTLLLAVALDLAVDLPHLPAGEPVANARDQGYEQEQADRDACGDLEHLPEAARDDRGAK